VKEMNEQGYQERMKEMSDTVTQQCELFGWQVEANQNIHVQHTAHQTQHGEQAVGSIAP
jgi:hypothetical protein